MHSQFKGSGNEVSQCPINGGFFWVIYILNRRSGPIFSLLPFFSHKLSNSTILYRQNSEVWAWQFLRIHHIHNTKALWLSPRFWKKDIKVQIATYQTDETLNAKKQKIKSQKTAHYSNLLSDLRDQMSTDQARLNNLEEKTCLVMAKDSANQRRRIQPNKTAILAPS